MRWLKRLAPLALLALVCFLPRMAARAAEDLPIAIEDGRGEARLYDGAAVDSLCLLYKNGARYLFLPAGWDRAALRVTFTGYEELYADYGGEQDARLTNGAVTDAFARADEVALYDQNRKRVCDVRVMQGSLPALFVRTETGSVKAIHSSKEVREAGALRMIDARGQDVYAGELAEIRARGNNTFKHPKKPYQLKLARKTELISGAGKAKTWVLLADYLDLSLLRNRITLDMAQYAGMRYAVACQSADLYVNGLYRGLYLLTEKVQVNPSRVDVAERDDEMLMLNGGREPSSFPFFKEQLTQSTRVAGFEVPVSPEDLTGGYLFQIDKLYRVQQTRNHGYVITNGGLGVVIESPEAASRAQAEYAERYLNAFERAICAKDGVDPETGKRYTDLADADSFALKYLLEDVSANYDAKAGSQYFYKDSDLAGGKLCAGPGWDYDLTYANLRKMRAAESMLANKDFSGSWWYALYSRQPDFRQRVNELYQERFLPALEVLLGLRQPAPDAPLRSLDEYEREIAPSAAMNFKRYPFSTIKGFSDSVGKTHDESLRFLRRFLAQRKDGLAQQYAEGAPSPTPAPPAAR